MDARMREFDIVLHLGYTSDSIWQQLWTKKAKHITNMDGLEWRRAKYSNLVKTFLKKAEAWAAKKSDFLIADSDEITVYLKSKYANQIATIAYGADIPNEFDESFLQEYQLEKYKYDLLIARMEPENHIEMAIEAKILSNSPIPLVIISNENSYRKKLKLKYADQKIILFKIADFRQTALNSLRKFSRYYIHGHSVGGTNPSLLEAMACGCRALAHENPFNIDVLGKGGNYFKTASELSEYLDDEGPLCVDNQQVEQNISNIKSNYQWSEICKKYEQLFLDIV